MCMFYYRLGFRVFCPNKPSRYGIRSYVICDSKTGYAFNMRPYCGEPGTLVEIVPDLLGRLKNHGYHLFMDNFYNSVAMCNRLLELRTHVCGTLRANRGAPPEVAKASNSTLKVGERVVRHTDTVLTLAWRDTRVVRMVTTFHQDEMVDVQRWKKGQGRISVAKPACVQDYNMGMNGVDKLDQNISYYPFIRKSYKWSTKYMMYMIQISVFNAFVLYQQRHPEGAVRNLMGFIECLVKGWTTPTKTPRAPRGRDPRSRLSSNVPPRPAEHLPVKIPAAPGAKNQTPARVCKVCKANGKRSETRFMCGHCHVPLHRQICFEEYHNVESYGGNASGEGPP